MSELKEQSCKPCEGGIAPHSMSDSKDVMKQLNAAWTLGVRAGFKLTIWFKIDQALEHRGW